MSSIVVSEQNLGSVLVSRSMAEKLVEAISAAIEKDPSTIEFDFEGVRVLAPSFLDQLVLVVERATVRHPRLVLKNCPGEMKAKIEAIGRAHDSDVQVEDSGVWVLTPPA